MLLSRLKALCFLGHFCSLTMMLLTDEKMPVSLPQALEVSTLQSLTGYPWKMDGVLNYPCRSLMLPHECSFFCSLPATQCVPSPEISVCRSECFKLDAIAYICNQSPQHDETRGFGSLRPAWAVQLLSPLCALLSMVANIATSCRLLLPGVISGSWNASFWHFSDIYFSEEKGWHTFLFLCPTIVPRRRLMVPFSHAIIFIIFFSKKISNFFMFVFSVHLKN